MAKIDFQKTFGSNSNSEKSGDPKDRPKAQYWLNFGYESDVKDDDGEYKFISLATGIPLDTQEDLPTNSRNRDFAAFQTARNELREQLMTAAQKLQPGEARIISVDESTGLATQMRRVDEVADDIPAGNNQFARKLDL